MNNQRLKILLVTPTPLYPILGGMELRIYNMVQPLCSQHDISLICFGGPDGQAGDKAHLARYFRHVEMVPAGDGLRKALSLPRKIRQLLAPPADLLATRSASPQMRDAINSFIKRERPDIIHVATAILISYFQDELDIPLVFDSIDDLSLYWRREIKNSRGLVRTAKAVKDWLLVRSFEKRYFPRFKEIIVSSYVDARMISSYCPGSNVTAIPNGVDCQYYQPFPNDVKEPVLIFSGVMDYPPNVAAALFLSQSIFPRIKEQIPDAHLIIAGRNPTRQIQDLEKEIPGIEVTGPVDDIRHCMARAQIYLCPLVSGAGIKNKILEAWASGKPIVATGLSCEGINVSPGEDVIVGDSPAEFAECTVRLLKDEALRKRMAENGRRKAVQLYSWSSKAEMLDKIYMRVSPEISSAVGRPSAQPK